MLDQEEEEGKEKVTEVSKRVQEAVHREDVAFEKLKAANTAKAEAAAETLKAASGRGEVEKTVKVLELHMEGNQKLLELEQKKKEASEALEAAKKAAEEAKKREKELAEESKAALHEQKIKASETLKGLKMTQTPEEKEELNKKKVQERQEKKALAAELHQIDKMRHEREKERQQRLKQAAGKSKAKRAGDAAGLPAKAARVVRDLD
eukprot:symbB.v1.2.007622.t1/scaffold469.1/size203783/3